MTLDLPDGRLDLKPEKGEFSLMQRRVFSGYDLFIVGCLLFALLAFHLFTAYRAQGEKYAEVSVNGEIDAEIALDSLEEQRYTPEALPGVEIAVKNGEAGFVRSDCPDKVCVHAGFLSAPGQSAVCLPNRVVLRIAARAPDADALDGTTY